MSLFQKADGIDVNKVAEEFVKHKIFRNKGDALAFLDKVDLDGNGALSYEEFCEGLESVNDYLQVLLLKKFIHSLQEKEYKNRMKHFKDSDKYSKAERLLKKDKLSAAAVVPKKVAASSGNIALAATITKVPIAGGGFLYTHSPAKKKVDGSAIATPLPSAKKSSPTMRKNSSSKAGSNAMKGAGKSASLPQMRGGAGSEDVLTKNSHVPSSSVRKMSVFIAPGNDAILYQNTLFEQAARQQNEQLQSRFPVSSSEPSLPSSPRDYDCDDRQTNRTSDDDLLRINSIVKVKVADFMSRRQLSFEEKQNLQVNDDDDSLLFLDDSSIVLEDHGRDIDFESSSDMNHADHHNHGHGHRHSIVHRTSSCSDSKITNKPMLAWTAESSSSRSPPTSARGDSRFRSRLVTAIENNNNDNVE